MIRPLVGKPNFFWTLVGVAVTAGILTGFAVPLAASYQPESFFNPKTVEKRNVAVLEIQPLVSAPQPSTVVVDVDPEMERLAERNRRLVALIATLRQRKADEPRQPADELGSRNN
jgi:hypothetical protein